LGVVVIGYNSNSIDIIFDDYIPYDYISKYNFTVSTISRKYGYSLMNRKIYDSNYVLRIIDEKNETLFEDIYKVIYKIIDDYDNEKEYTLIYTLKDIIAPYVKKYILSADNM
jgi:hypothetical protein